MVSAAYVLTLLLAVPAQRILPIAVVTSTSTPAAVVDRVHSNFEALKSIVENEYSGRLAVFTYWENVNLTNATEDFRFPGIISQKGIKVVLDATCHTAYSKFLGYCAYLDDLLHIVLERIAESGEVPGPNSVYMEPSPGAHALAFSQLVSAFGWTHLGLFYNSEPRNRRSAEEFKRAMPAASFEDEVEVDERSSDALFFVESRLRTTRFTQSKVAVVFADSVTAAHLLLSADENGIGGTGFAWVLSSQAMQDINSISKLSNADVASFRFGLMKTGLIGLVEVDYQLLQKDPIYYYLLLSRMVVQIATSGINSGAATRKVMLSTTVTGAFPLQFSQDGFREVGLIVYNMVDFVLYEVGRWDPVTGALDLDRSRIVWPGGSLQIPNDNLSIIKIAILLPLTDESGSPSALGQSVSNGVLLAIKEATGHPEFLRNAVISPVFLNTASTAGLAAANVRSVASANVLGFIGPGSSGILPEYMREMEKLLSAKPVVSYGVSAANFTSPDKYPYFLRTIQPDGAQAVALTLLIDRFKWRRVAVVYTDDDYGRGLYSSFASNIGQLAIEMQNDEASREVVAETEATLSELCIASIENALDSVIRHQLRVVVYLGSWRTGAELLLRAYRKDLTGSLYVWLSAMWLSADTLASLRSVYSAAEYQEILQALEGTLALDHLPPLGEVGDNFLQSYEKEYRSTPTPHATIAYDTMWLYIRAVSSMISRGEDYYRGADLMSALRATEFTGASGPLHIAGASNDRNAYGFSVLNVQNGQLVEVYVYDPVSSSIFNTTLSPLRLPDPSIIADSFVQYSCPFPLHMVRVSPTGVGIVIAIGSTLFLLTLALSVCSYSKWKMVEITLIRDHVKKTWRDSLVELTIGIEFFQLLALAPKFEAVQEVLKDLTNVVMLDFMSMSKVSQTNDSSSYWTELIVISVLCYLWLGMVVTIACGVDQWLKKVPGCFKAFTLVSGVYLPLVGNSLFLPFTTLLLDAFVCDHQQQGKAFVYRDCYMPCWTTEHHTYVVITVLAIIAFEPMAVFSRPMWQQSKVGLNLMLKPLFLLFKTCTQILLIAVGKSLQGTSSLAHGVVFSVLMLAYVAVAVRVLPFNYHRCNLWEIASLLGVLYFSLIATVSQGYYPENLGWFAGLAVGWGVIVVAGVGIQLMKFPSHFHLKGESQQRRIRDLLGEPPAAQSPQPPDAESMDLNIVAPSVSPDEVSQLSANREDKPDTERSEIALKNTQRDQSELHT